jgi:dTDP-4-amino-4,6-dideoxygalactose transaminase
MIPLFWPQQFKKEWLKALSNVFGTRWLGQGPMVEQFEKEFGKKFKYDYCLAVNSGSASIELAYHLVGIEAGDEVITTVFTCTATNIPLVRMGAKIIFADVNNDLLINYEDTKRKINKKTKAIVIVTLGGLPVDERIFDLAKSRKIPIIVDAAQSVGVSENQGDYVCYSFQAIKHFTTGDGGMLVLRNKKEYDHAKKLRWFGIDREAKRRVNFQCLNNREITMEIEEPGFKFHMNDIAAAMGLVGLRHTDEILKYRKLLCNTYSKNLPKNIKPICGGSYWLMAIITNDRDDVIEYLRNNGVECDMVQLRNDIFQVFGGKKQNLPNMNRLESKYLYLPLNPKVTVNDIKHICKLLCDR